MLTHTWIGTPTRPVVSRPHADSAYQRHSFLPVPNYTGDGRVQTQTTRLYWPSRYLKSKESYRDKLNDYLITVNCHPVFLCFRYTLSAQPGTSFLKMLVEPRPSKCAHYTHHHSYNIIHTIVLLAGCPCHIHFCHRHFSSIHSSIHIVCLHLSTYYLLTSMYSTSV